MVRKILIRFSWVFTIALLLNHGCQESILVGSDLLENEKLFLLYNDSLKMSSKTIAPERVITHQPSVSNASTFDYRTYLLGQLDDNLYGKVDAALIIKNQFSSTGAPTYQSNKATLKFDSLILSLQLDTLGTYANDKVEHMIDIYPLTSTFAIGDTFYSDVDLPYNTKPLFQNRVVVSTKDSVTVKDHITRVSKKQIPQLRLKLNDEFGEKLLLDSLSATFDSSFMRFLPGMYIKSTPIGKPSIFGLNLSNAALATNGVNKLIMYYTVNDTVRKQYEYPISATTINQYKHNTTGSQVDEFIKNPSKGDSLTFIQGMGGVKTVISFDDLSYLKGKLLNRVELEMFLYDVPNQNGSYSPPVQIYASHKDDNGKLVLIPDVAQFLTSGVSFGGLISGTGALRKYTINITNHIKEILADPTYNPDLYIGLVGESQLPKRTAIYGAKHSTLPMKLKVTYTKN